MGELFPSFLKMKEKINTKKRNSIKKFLLGTAIIGGLAYSTKDVLAMAKTDIGKISNGGGGGPSLPIDINSDTTGTLNLNRGGTGKTSFSANQLLYGNLEQTSNFSFNPTNNNINLGKANTWIQADPTLNDFRLYLNNTETMALRWNFAEGYRLGLGKGVSAITGNNIITFADNDRGIRLTSNGYAFRNATTDVFTVAPNNLGINQGNPNINLAIGHPNCGFAEASGGLNVFTGTGTGAFRMKFHQNGGLMFNSSADPQTQIAFTDQGLGFRNVATHTLGFFSQNVERMRFNNSGNFGIGTTSPSARLDVDGSIRFRSLTSGVLQTDGSGNVSSNSLNVNDVVFGNLQQNGALTTNFASSIFSLRVGQNGVAVGLFEVIDPSDGEYTSRIGGFEQHNWVLAGPAGQLGQGFGIGTRTPTARLHISALTASDFRDGIFVDSFDGDSGTERRGININTVSSALAYGVHATATGKGAGGPAVAGYFEAIEDGDETGNTTGIYATAGSSAGTNLAGHFASGNVYMENSVGIGLNNPARQLHIQRSGATAGLAVERTSSNTSAFLALAVSNEIQLYFRDSAGGSTARQWRIYQGNTERMRMDTSGNIAINKTSATQRLDVNGNIRATGYRSSDNTAGITETITFIDMDSREFQITSKNGIITTLQEI